VSAAGVELARGYSRETAPTAHAEEAALTRVHDDDLAGATLYSSLEPCGVRTSRPVPCARLIADTAISRVVFALREPPTLAPGGGAAMLRAAGVEVVEIQQLADAVRAVNAHLFGDVRR
jgi:diaminohydroxyphosphoribosylaminopyrimidine deaminase/5-amino-6-(5-phosphoribosylamino)uracil reductase